LSGFSGPDDLLVPDNAYFDPYCPINDLQNDLAHGNDLPDHLSQIDPPEITVYNGIPCDDNSPIDFHSLIISSSTDSDDQEPDSPPERPSRVRFRSRVRIASGLNRHRHKHQGVDYLSPDFSPSPSISGSPSSSISAPLRTTTDEQVGKPGWGTLGQRVSMFAQGKMERRRSQERERERLGVGASSFGKGGERGGFRGGQAPAAIPYYTRVDEGTPLLWSRPRNASYTDLARQDQVSLMPREIDKVFGPWPGRLANPHWWWWQTEPIICCRCLSDIDDEC